MDRVERWEAALGAPSRRDENPRGVVLTWDSLGIMISANRNPDGHGYVSDAHLDLGDARAASPARRWNHEQPHGQLFYPTQGFRESLSWNGVRVEGAALILDEALSQMDPKPFVHRSMSQNMNRLEVTAWDPDVFAVRAYADIACQMVDSSGRALAGHCEESIDEIHFEVTTPFE
jgi:hypothetical protein